MPNQFAVMGNPIEHSLSPQIHQYFAGQTGISLIYEKKLIPLEQFEAAVQQFFSEGGRGLNITLPFKERAFAMADKPTARARQARAANTLWMDKGLLFADNTDGIGLVRDLPRHFKKNPKNSRCLILGAGGAARGIIGPLLQMGFELSLANRSPAKAQTLLTDFPELIIRDLATPGEPYDLIINASSATAINLPTTILNKDSFCYDLSYRAQAKTPFIKWACSQNVPCTDGLGMLIEQAAESFFIWHGVNPECADLIIRECMSGTSLLAP